MSGLFAKARRLPGRFPLLRGMASYGVSWPASSLAQGCIERGPAEPPDWPRAARFSVFGALFMAPVFYGWLRLSSRLFVRNDLATAVKRAAVEQVSYSPLALAYFFFGMSLLEMKPLDSCVNEVREKFWPTYRYNVIFWPVAQTLNFYYVSEKNRILFVSAASFVWTVYLSHVKAKEQRKKMNGRNEE